MVTDTFTGGPSPDWMRTLFAVTTLLPTALYVTIWIGLALYKAFSLFGARNFDALSNPKEKNPFRKMSYTFAFVVAAGKLVHWIYMK